MTTFREHICQAVPPRGGVRAPILSTRGPIPISMGWQPVQMMSRACDREGLDPRHAADPTFELAFGSCRKVFAGAEAERWRLSKARIGACVKADPVQRRAFSRYDPGLARHLENVVWVRGFSLSLARDLLGLARERDGAVFQAIANEVERRAPIKQWRESAAHPRLHFATSPAKGSERGAAGLFGGRLSITAEIVSEIDRAFIHPQQRVDRRPFGVNDVMAFELDVEELQFIAFIRRLMAGDGLAVDQASSRNQQTIDHEGVPPRYVEIGMRNVGRETEAAMRTGSASLTQGFDGSLFLIG